MIRDGRPLNRGEPSLGEKGFHELELDADAGVYLNYTG